MQRDRLSDGRPEPGRESAGADRLVLAVQPVALGHVATVVDQVAIVVQQRGDDQAVGRSYVGGKARALQRVIELGHPLAVTLVSAQAEERQDLVHGLCGAHPPHPSPSGAGSRLSVAFRPSISA